jgi:hypothetical protein
VSTKLSNRSASESSVNKRELKKLDKSIDKYEVINKKLNIEHCRHQPDEDQVHKSEVQPIT